ncbi:hypothetical protein KGQ27_01190 [Patescibacteria group bacterium]|nr:hypothetical protein [Patescibacteria group bacterium]MDE1946542.1 hypothetical protein [Patescibacteria group bacterium]MDE2232781.1 hypothetical protein [Patescibacteria group bacterium]
MNDKVFMNMTKEVPYQSYLDESGQSADAQAETRFLEFQGGETGECGKAAQLCLDMLHAELIKEFGPMPLYGRKRRHAASWVKSTINEWQSDVRAKVFENLTMYYHEGAHMTMIFQTMRNVEQLS